MIDLETQKETLTNAVKTVADGTTAAGTKAKDLSSSAVKTVSDHKLVVRVREIGGSATSSAGSIAKDVFEKAQTATGKGVEKVSELPLGEKNVGEVAQSTVDTVQDKIDVDQIQDQVSKLRDQIEGVLGSWTDTFRPATATKSATTKKAAKPAVKTTKTAATKTKKATTAKATASKKAATPKATATKKPATKKAASAKK
ncbi:MAG: hypothetical protein M3132_07510 [Actinomycetia bacterium]|nr:hypothetical protein [Actinomycetes bacterium]